MRFSGAIVFHSQMDVQKKFTRSCSSVGESQVKESCRWINAIDIPEVACNFCDSTIIKPASIILELNALSRFGRIFANCYTKLRELNTFGYCHRTKWDKIHEKRVFNLEWTMFLLEQEAVADPGFESRGGGGGGGAWNSKIPKLVIA